MEKNSYRLGELTWPEAAKRLKEVDIVLFPVGSLEQHGPYLPLDTDAFDAPHLAEQVALRCSEPKPLVLPLLPFGVSYHHDDFPGTLSISNDTLSRLVYEIGMSAARIFTCVDTGETSDVDLAALCETPNDVHAGEIETSTSLASRPELVKMEKAKSFVPRFSSHYLDFSSKRSVDWYARTAKISPSGVLGDPSKASREKGEKLWEIMIHNLLEFVEHLKKLSLDEIYEKRY